MEFLHKKENNVLISGILVTLLLVGMAVGQSNQDSVDVDVSINAATIIDVNPNATNFGSLDIGSTSSDKGFYIENIGSNAISNIEANVSGNDTNPFGSSSAGAFDAGQFIVMNGSSTSTLFYIYKREWNESVPPYVTPPTGWEEGVYTGTFGRFRTASAISGATEGQEYFWFLNKTAGQEESLGGNCSNGTLYIGLVNHTKEWTGSVDFSNANQYFTVTLEDGGTNFGFGNVSNPGHALDAYCVRVAADCQTADFFHWDVDLDAYNRCTGSVEYVYSGTLNPGDTTTVYLQARIPYGVGSGSPETGTVTFIAS